MGLYPLARALGAPVVGLLARKIGMRWAFSMSLFSMILGNVIYLASSTHLATGEEIKEMKEDYESGGILSFSLFFYPFLSLSLSFSRFLSFFLLFSLSFSLLSLFFLSSFSLFLFLSFFLSLSLEFNL